MKAMRRTGKCVVLVSVAALVAGCSADDIEFNGGLFDMVGLGSNNPTKGKEPKMAARAPLVLPPKYDRIPEPGTPPESASEGIAALNDPDRAAQVSRAELERQQAEYCRKNYELAKAHGDETGADLAAGPLGPCRGSVLTAIDKWNKEEEE